MADDGELKLRPKKIIKRHGGHHGGAWKVAYADFVTAMMALFMVLWILSQGPEVKNSVAAYFTDPRGVPVVQPSKGTLDNMGVGIMDKMPNVGVGSKGEGSGERFAEALTNEATPKPGDPKQKSGGGPGGEGNGAAAKKLRDAGEKIAEAIKANPKLAEVSKAISVRMTDEGLRIELREQQGGTFFDSGKANPKPALRKVLREVMPEIVKTSQPVVVEGHTDAKPYSAGAGYTNWELSADRGNALRRLMLGLGATEERIREVRALADRRPLPDMDPLDPRNRRVSILVALEEPVPGLTDEGEDLMFENPLAPAIAPGGPAPDPNSPMTAPAAESGTPAEPTSDAH
ncbi:MAG: OmpA family protein [Deltaproteobacteria bacterium]|nr:OmpA family protein [Deltaproteobacteria bacterium]